MALKKQAAHSAQAIITFNHWALSQSFAGFSPQGLIYPPSSWGKISFTRRIAERASPTSPYKSFFNQRPLRLGADTRGSNTVTPQLLPMCISAVLGVFILFCFHLGFVCICISHRETKRDGPPCTLQHPPLLQERDARHKITGFRLREVTPSQGWQAKWATAPEPQDCWASESSISLNCSRCGFQNMKWEKYSLNH